MPGPSGEIDPHVAGLIRLVVLDVDGVLTDGGIYVGAWPGQDAIELKRFDIQDGLGIKMLRWAGIDVAIVSGRVSEATARRASPSWTASISSRSEASAEPPPTN